VDWAKRLPNASGRVSLLLSGVAYGRQVGVAEYSYTLESMADSKGSRSSTTYHFVVTVVWLDVVYPPLAVESRGALSRLGRAVFGDNAAATGHDAFDRRYRVRTRDPSLARSLLGPALIAAHLAVRFLSGTWPKTSY
jgi:hypothetical protein